MEITLSKEIAAPASRVWQIITGLEGCVQVITGIDSIEILAGEEQFGVGTRWRETRTMLGKQATEEMEVTAIEPGRSYVVEAGRASLLYRSTLTVSALGDERSRLSMPFGAEPKGMAARVLAATVGRLFVGFIRKALRQDLDDVTAAAEAG